jgi:hypothetical protein
MKPFFGSIVFTIFLILVSDADAQTNIGTSVFSWNPQLLREDNTFMSQSEIAGYLVGFRPEGKGAYTEVRVDAKSTEIPLTVPFGNYEARVLCWDINGLRSEWSSIKKFTVKSAPKKPLYPSVRVVQ